MSLYDQELAKSLEGSVLDCTILDAATAESFFDALNKRFPVSGTQINWIKAGVYYKKLDNHLDEDGFRDSIAVLKDRHLPDFDNTTIVYIGDSLTENAYRLRLKDINAFYSHIKVIPQHHYFVDDKVRWCIALNMTDHFDFGYSSVSASD